MAALAAGTFCISWQGLTPFQRWSEKRSGSVVSRLEYAGRSVALTFDDGPDPRYTPHVLDVLRDEHVSATFFLVGRNVEAYPDLARRIVAEGHAVGNHTYSHIHLEASDARLAAREVLDGERAIERATGVHPLLFRPPRGLWSPAVFDEARRERDVMLLWSVAFDRQAITDDSALRDRLVGLVRPGDIILFHDGSVLKRDERGAMVRQLRSMIRTMRSRGYGFLGGAALEEAVGAHPVGHPAREHVG